MSAVANISVPSAGALTFTLRDVFDVPDLETTNDTLSAEIMAQTMGVPFIGRLPINMDLRRNSDEGTPTANWESDATLGEEIDRLCRNLAGQISIASLGGKLIQPTLNVT